MDAERDRINIDRAHEDGMNGARGSCADPGVCYKVAMTSDVMASRLGPAAGAQHAGTGPDQLTGVAEIGRSP